MNKNILICLTILSLQFSTAAAQINRRFSAAQTQTVAVPASTSVPGRVEIGDPPANKMLSPTLKKIQSPANNSILTSIMVNSLKIKTYPNGSKAQYNMVRKGDNEYADNPKIDVGKKDNSAEGGVKVISADGTKICKTITKHYTVTTMNQDMLSPSVLNNISLGAVYNLTAFKRWEL